MSEITSETTSEEKGTGLQPIIPDVRDFNLGASFPLPRLEDIPKHFIVADLPIENQGSSDFCAAYSSCKASEAQEGVPLEPSYTFAYSKMLTRDKESWGQNLRDICRAHVKAGAIEKPAPSVHTHSVDYLRDITNWTPEDRVNAEAHRKASFFAIKGQYDAFGNLQSSLWRFQSKNCLAIFGVQWTWNPTQIVMDEDGESNLGGHALLAIGAIERDGKPYIVVQNSWGTGAGENGRHYFGREVINKYAAMYGMYMFVDIDETTIKQVKKQQWTVWMRIAAALRWYFKQLA